MNKPAIQIDGMTYLPPSPKMKVWREYLKFFEKDKTGMDMKEFLDEHVRLIILAFDEPEVNAESIDEHVEVEKIVPLTQEIFRWVQSMTFSKLVDIPNGEAGKE